MTIKVCFLTELLTSGGTAKHLCELLPYLKQHEIEPFVLMRGEFGRYAQVLVDAEIPVIRFKKYKEILDFLNKNEMDIVHSYLYGPHIGDVMVCKLLRVPYIKSTSLSHFCEQVAIPGPAKTALP